MIVFVSCRYLLILIAALQRLVSSGVGLSPLQSGEVLLEARKFSEALVFFNEYLQRESNNVQAMEGAAVAFANMGNFVEAAHMFENASKIKPVPEFFYNGGKAYLQGGDPISAIRLFSKCTATKKAVARQCHIKLAQCFRDLENFDEVQLNLLAAIKLDPSQPDAYSYLADTYNNLKQFKLAIDVYDRALSIQPNDPSLWNAKGDAYSNMKNQVEAANCYKNARKLSPPGSSIATDALIGSYFASMETGNWYEWELNTLTLLTATAYAAELHLKRRAPPTSLSPYRMLFFQAPAVSLSVATGWSNSLVQEGLAASMLQESKSAVFASNKMKLAHLQCEINIGYLSRRFEDYPGTQMMLRIFGSHNRSRVCVHTFAHGADDGSSVRQVVAHTSDVFEDISKFPSEQGSQVIHSYDVDVLIDYDGLHDYNSIKLLGRRPALVQVTWLGFAGTTGQGSARSAYTQSKNFKNPTTPAVEFIIADKTVLPPDSLHASYVSEHVVYLPGSYQPQDEVRDLSSIMNDLNDRNKEDGVGEGVVSSAQIAEQSSVPTTAAGYEYLVLSANRQAELIGSQHNEWASTRRRNAELKEMKLIERKRLLRIYLSSKSSVPANDTEGFEQEDNGKFDEDQAASLHWLICFNRLSKVTPEVFQDWMQGMVRYPRSILVLMAESPTATLALRQHAAYWGIQQRRLLFFPRLSRLDYYTILAVSDLFLDTRSYGSHTVASDALWTGLPVLTLAGPTFASRVAASLNMAGGKSDLFTVDSRQRYVDACVEFVTKDGGDYLRNLISFRGNGLFNSTAFADRLEFAYLSMFEVKSLTSPRHIFFTDM